MSPKKLSEADKNEILRLYRHSPETTSTLATHYGVSSSTISRFLKSNLPEAEYEALIQQKRALALGSITEVATPATLFEQIHPVAEISVAAGMEESRERSNFAHQLEIEIEPAVSVFEVAEELELPLSEISDSTSLPIDIEAEDDSGLDEDFDEDWEDEEVDDEEDESDLLNLVPRRSHVSKIAETVKILPLAAASLPKVCYLVVDKSAELIARPLRDFSDLGSIPDSEIQQKTLPVFPNHRVAMRFSNRSQKVIKVPDSGILQRTSPQLQAKGITRLLLNGQVYAL